jgi:hypothetical protein
MRYGLRVFVKCFLLSLPFSLVAAGEPQDGQVETTLMKPVVVTAKTRGIVPVDFFWVYNRISRSLLSDLILISSVKPDETVNITYRVRNEVRTFRITFREYYDMELAPYGLKPTDRVVAVDGREVLKMSTGELEHWRSEGGEAGDSVTLTVVGGAREDVFTFREVKIKRVLPRTYLELLAQRRTPRP